MDYKMETKIIQDEAQCSSFAEKDLFYFLQDVLEITPTILCINYFEVPEKDRNKGLGTSILKQFCEERKESHIILLIAGFPNNENEAEPTTKEVGEKLIKLEHFYASVGFANVNEQFGQYESKRTFIYDGGIGSSVIANIENNESGE